MSSIFDLDEFKPFAARYQHRVTELVRRRGYYDGTVYKKLKTFLGSILGPEAPKLYQGIKPLYLPLARAVDVDAGIIPGGWSFGEDAPDDWAAARDTVFAWSAWQTDGVLYVHYGAQYGISGLKVVDDRKASQVLVKPVDPTRFLLVGNGRYDPTPRLAIWVEETEDARGEVFEYAEVIDAGAIRTFRDGEPAGFEGREAEYPNELGFVPFVEVRHIETGEALGESTFQKAIPLLDEVNELASYLADIIKKHAEPQWAILGAEATDLVHSGDNVWFIPGGGDAKALVARVDIAGVLEFVREVRDNVHGALPELAFDELRKKDQIATATLELQMMELVLKIKRTRPNYDDGLVRALRRVGQAAAGMGLSDIAVLDDEALALDDERTILPLDPKTAMELEMMQLALEQQRAMGMAGEGVGIG